MDNKIEDFWNGPCCRNKKSYYYGYFFFFLFTFLFNYVVYILTPEGCCNGDNISIRFVFSMTATFITGCMSRCICLSSKKIRNYDDLDYDELNNSHVVWYNQ